MVLPLPAGHIENIFGRACTCRKYFAPAALGSVHQSEDWWWGGSEGSPLPSEISQTNATGFINLWGLPDTVLALREQGKL